MLALAEGAPGTVKASWNSDAGQWLLREAAQLNAVTNVVTNAVTMSGITNNAVLPATNSINYFRLERSAAPGHVEVGP